MSAVAQQCIYKLIALLLLLLLLLLRCLQNARNVLITSSSSSLGGYSAKLADLGLSRTIKQHTTHHTTCTVGTMSHMVRFRKKEKVGARQVY